MHPFGQGWQRRGEQSESQDANKPDGPESHNGLLYCYEGTNITGKKVVKDAKMQLNDALIESRRMRLQNPKDYR